MAHICPNLKAEGLIASENIRSKRIKAIFTTRINGAKDDPLAGLNLSFTEEVNEEVILSNRSYVASFFGVGLDSLLFPLQRHTDKVVMINNPTMAIEADAMVTTLKGIVLGVLVADCAPILIYDSVTPAIAAVHAGWRGTAFGIIKMTLALMKKEFNTSLSEIFISIGPSIRWCCYEVGHDVINAIKKETGEVLRYSKEKENGKYLLDIATANRLQAVASGVPDKNIWTSEECTYCLPERFYSARYYKCPTGRQGGFIGLMG